MRTRRLRRITKTIVLSMEILENVQHHLKRLKELSEMFFWLFHVTKSDDIEKEKNSRKNVTRTFSLLIKPCLNKVFWVFHNY